MEKAYNQGWDSQNYSECPYKSGQQVYYSWCDGFVDGRDLRREHIPENTPSFLAGRISYLRGKDITEKPANEKYDGRWVSGWMTEQSRQEQLDNRIL